MHVETTTVLPALKNIAVRLRIDSLRSTTAAGSGHPTTCCSAADLVAALFFSEMRFDPKNPRHPLADRFVLSKGHAAPILYAWHGRTLPTLTGPCMPRYSSAIAT